MKPKMNSKIHFANKITKVLSIFLIALLFSLTPVFAQDSTSTEQTQEAESSADGAIPSDAGAISAGEALFKANCKSCHKLDAKSVGPALQGVTERRDLSWLKQWIPNAPKMISDGDPIATELYDEYGSVMTSFQSFKEADVLNILAYIKAWEPPVAEATSGSSGNTVETDGGGSSESTTLILGVVLIVLVLIIVVLILLSAILLKSLKEKEDTLSDIDKEQVNQTHNVITVLKHPAFIGIVVTICLLAGFLFFLKGFLYDIGVQQGYAPTQPIPFSHKLHAGDHQIDCNYCHTGVRKSKNANIPSANICMNCHSEIKTESPLIKQIYESIDYDPETKTYGDNVKPIKWVRIHNLPDLAYFNHSQHVAVGGIECETCHGPVEEMEVVRQFSPLTMGWCVNCHRETAVNGDNDYYDKLLEIHEKDSKEPMTVENIGGLECAKCHY